MTATINARERALIPVSVGARSLLPNRYDLMIFVIIVAALAAVLVSSREISQPLAALALQPVTLDPLNLPRYAILSTARMFAALVASLLFTFVFATLAAKSRKAELVIVPALDILQSVPVLGFLTFTVVFFLRLFPGRELGAELAAIFAIFTSQAWNMAFSLYQSLKTTPRNLEDVSTQFRLSPWQRFWRLDAPYATPGLVWNTMMSMSGGWFFVVASEAISVGNTQIALPGIGSFLALAISQENTTAIGLAVAAMAIVILLYDQLVFRPVVVWADKFRVETTAATSRPRSWLYDTLRRTRASRTLAIPFVAVAEFLSRMSIAPNLHRGAAGDPVRRAWRALWLDRAWTVLVAIACLAALWELVQFARQSLGFADIVEAISGGLATLLRVIVLIAIASVIWVPVGVWLGLRPAWAQRAQPVAQFLAAFPANVLFPVFVVVIARYGLNANIWLSPLMILGTQWYILFNVISGASVFPTELLEAARLSGVGGWQWWRKVILPGIFPHYLTGALTASGGCWNASIVAETVSWGKTKLQAVGLGSYIAKATESGDYHRVVLGIVVMSVFVILLNRLLWRRLYLYAEQRLRID